MALAVLGVGVARDARADDGSELEFARTRVSSGLYDEAVKRLVVMLEAKLPSCDKGPPGACRLTDADLVEQARSLLVVSLVALGRETEADAQIETILRNNPSFVAAPPLFPVRVADRFTTVKVRIKPDLDAINAKRAAAERAKQEYEQRRAAWLADVVGQASEQKVVERNSRLLALLPFGVGHFENGRPAVGTSFVVAEAVTAVGTFVTAGIVYASIAAFNNFQTNPTGTQQLDKDAFNARVDTAATVNRVFFGLWAAVTLADITSAQLTFVPEQTHTEKRTIKPEPKPPVIAPTIGYVPHGATFGLVGTF